MAARKLGRGLDSLLTRGPAEAAAGGPAWVPLDALEPNPQQPRKDLERGLASLAESIARHGVMQPILVTPAEEDGKYRILAGERRWRASRLAGLKQVPVLIREAVGDAAMSLELALIENLQREDLDPIERALACQELLETHGLTQEEVARRLGYERSTVANLVRLLELPLEIQEHVSRGTLSAGHARALLRLQGRPEQGRILKAALAEGWSVRQTEAACKAAAEGRSRPVRKARPRKPAWANRLQEEITRRLGLRAEVKLLRRGGGQVVLHFADLDELDALARTLELPDEAGELLDG